MHLTRFTDNALRCLTYLALHPGETETVGTIARRMALSEDHLVKVVQRLAHLGYVETMRGRGGGVRLIVEPAKINIGAVIRQTEENFRLVECFDERTNTCPNAPSCGLAPALDEALKAFLAVLDKYTLADFTRSQRKLTRLLIA
ncbi:MAG: Rrf2 family transcriptional regulator [Gemmatimonadaceae bacterium]|nr:Rrf2 family transcriptional regulator [Gemmatimonadaceae bacterium]